MKLTLKYPPAVNTLYGVRATIPRDGLMRVLEAVRQGRLPPAAAAPQIQKLAMAFPYKTREHTDYAAAFSKAVRHAYPQASPWWPRPAQLAMTVDLYRPRRIGDIDGPLKTLLDVGQALIYENDSQISKLTVERYDDKDNPRAEVSVERREVPGEQFDLVEAEPERAGAVVTDVRRPVTQRDLAAKATSGVVSFRRPTRNTEE